LRRGRQSRRLAQPRCNIAGEALQAPPFRTPPCMLCSAH
jgi:hypothetical protein